MAPTDAQLALQNPQPQPLRVTQVSPPGTPLVSTHPAAQGHGASGSWAPPPPQETMNSVNADSQPGQMRRLQPGEEARPGAGSLGGLDELAGKVENLTTPIENYTEAGREEHPFLSRVGDITRGAKELLVGHQTPMGAQSGIGTNAVTALILPEDIALMRGEEGMAAEGASAEKKAVDLAQKALPVVKKGANAVVDALAHPTHGAVPIEGNPEFGGLRVRKVLGPTEAKVPAHQNPVLQRLSEKYGETEDASGVTNGASFLTKEGKFIHMPPGATHDEAVRLADIEKQYQPEEGKTDPRPQFIKDTDAVRVRTRGTNAGKEISISVPENGVTPEQVEGLKAATHAQVGQRGSVVMEVATPGGKTAENDFANANDVEPMLKQIGAHPESTPPGADRYDLGDVSEKNLSNEILQAHTENGGSTFNPAKGNLNGTDNYAVAAFPQRNEVISGELTPEHVQQFIDKNQDLLADPKNSIGTWVDESGKHSLDIVHTIPDRDAAVKMGEESNQKAIFDLKNMTEIPTGGTGEVPAKHPTGSSVPLIGAPLKVPNTKPGEMPMTIDVAKALSKATKQTLGALKPGSEESEMTKRAAELGEDEARYQLATDNTGETWYQQQMKNHDATIQKIRPELEDPAKMSLFHFNEAILSSGQKPYGNAKSAIKAWDAYQDTGKFPRMNPATGKSWGPRGEAAYGNAFDMMNTLIEQKGEQGASDWFLSDHPVSELRQYNKDVPGKNSDMKPGAYILGQKRGPFGMNLHGIETEFTADMWVSRTWNRWMGTAEVVKNKEGIPELSTDAPRNNTERRLMKESFEKIAQKFNKTTSQMQAVLWYYEQGLYRAHGLNTESWSFEDAAARAAKDLGPRSQATRGKMNAMDFLGGLGKKKETQ